MARIPTHPGAILREDALPALKISITAAAKQMQISRQQLHKILREEAPVTSEMALRLGKFLGNGAGIWLRMQAAHDLAKAEIAMAGIVKKIPTAKAA